MNIDTRNEQISSTINALENTPEEIRQETLRLLKEADNILKNAKTSEKYESFKKEYDEMNQKWEEIISDNTISAEELNQLRNELIDVEAGEDLWAFGRLKRNISGLVDEGSDMLDASSEAIASHIGDLIISTNQDLIKGGVTEIDTTIGSIQSVLDNWITKTALGDKFEPLMKKLEGIKQSSGNVHNKLFELSDFIHDIGEILYHYFPSLQGNIIEKAHHIGTEELIKNIIEHKEGTEVLAIKFDKGSKEETTNNGVKAAKIGKGYEVTSEADFISRAKNIDLTNTQNKHEVGTFLCGLADVRRLNLQELTEIFGAEKLIQVLNMYKDGDFGGENFAGSNWTDFYKTRLENNSFSEKMGEIIQTKIASGGLSELNDLIQSGIKAGKTETQNVISSCNLCESIGNVAYSDISKISIETWELLEDNDANKPFYEAIMQIKELHEAGQAQVSSIIIESLGNNVIDESTKQYIDEASKRIYNSSIHQLEQQPCGLQLKGFIRDSEELSNLQEFLLDKTGIELNIDEITQKSSNIMSSINIKEKEVLLETIKSEKERSKNMLQSGKLTILQKQSIQNKIDEFSLQESTLENDLSISKRIYEVSKNSSMSDVEEFEKIRQELIAQGKNPDEALALFLEQTNNSDLKNTINKYNNTQKKENKNTDSYQEQNTNYIYTEEDYTKIGENNYQIHANIDGKEVPISITEKEKDLTLGNPEALKNLVDSYKFFTEVKMTSIWEYRNDIETSIGDRTMNFQDGDLMSKNDILKLGNTVLAFINGTEGEGRYQKANTVNGLKLSLQHFSGALDSTAGDVRKGLEGDDPFEYLLRNQGIIGGIAFKKDTFKQVTKKGQALMS